MKTTTMERLANRQAVIKILVREINKSAILEYAFKYQDVHGFLKELEFVENVKVTNIWDRETKRQLPTSLKHWEQYKVQEDDSF